MPRTDDGAIPVRHHDVVAIFQAVRAGSITDSLFALFKLFEEPEIAWHWKSDQSSGRDSGECRLLWAIATREVSRGEGSRQPQPTPPHAALSSSTRPCSEARKQRPTTTSSVSLSHFSSPRSPQLRTQPAKATDENLTGEDWETVLNLCDKVQDEGEMGFVSAHSTLASLLILPCSARNVISALLKRLAHRSPTVQLYALSLAESLSKNCGIVLHRELSSRVFTQGLERLVTDRVGVHSWTLAHLTEFRPPTTEYASAHLV